MLGRIRGVERPARFEEFRFLGDKRTQRVYDLDSDDRSVESAVADLMAAEAFTCFGPDSLAEARNRGYRPPRSARAADGG